jgi:hypothetical protein
MDREEGTSCHPPLDLSGRDAGFKQLASGDHAVAPGRNPGDTFLDCPVLRVDMTP